MKATKKENILSALIVIIAGGLLYYVNFYKPKNSIELYQEMHFVDNFEEMRGLMLDGFEDNFTEEEFNYIRANPVNRIGQFTLIEYNDKSYVVMTSPGTKRLKILAVEELPVDIREFFSELPR